MTPSLFTLCLARPPRRVQNRCWPHVSLWSARDLWPLLSPCQPQTLKRLYIIFATALHTCMFMVQRLHSVWKCSLFSPFNTEAASIIQRHIAEHNATDRIAFFSLSLPLDSSVFICLLLRLFLCPHFVSLTPSPSALSYAHFVFLCHVSTTRAVKSHFFLHSLVSISLFSLLFFLLLIYIFFTGISFLCVHSLSPLSSLLCPFSFFKIQSRQFRGAGGEAGEEERVWPPTLQHSIVLHWVRHVPSLTHTHKIGHTRWVESSTPCSLVGGAYSLGIRAVRSWVQIALFSIMCPELTRHQAPMVSKSRTTDGEGLEQ